MRQRLLHRLDQLEQQRSQAQAVDEARDCAASADRAREKFRLFLRFRGVQQGPTESLATASARALEISVAELRVLLAGGIDPIQKYFVEHGLLSEDDRRKAAGTWPGGSGKESEKVRL